MTPPLPNAAATESPRARWGRRGALVVLAGLLFLLGQFDEAVYAGLTSAWQAVVGGPAAAAAGPAPGISVHSVPVALAFRLLYYVLNVATLHVLLRGRGTRQIALGYGALLALLLLLLVGARVAHAPALTRQAHTLINAVCSPLALMLIYGSAALFQQSVAPPKPAG